jgi:hypothetical protein
MPPMRRSLFQALTSQTFSLGLACSIKMKRRLHQFEEKRQPLSFRDYRPIHTSRKSNSVYRIIETVRQPVTSRLVVENHLCFVPARPKRSSFIGQERQFRLFGIWRSAPLRLCRLTTSYIFYIHVSAACRSGNIYYCSIISYNYRANRACGG